MGRFEGDQYGIDGSISMVDRAVPLCRLDFKPLTFYATLFSSIQVTSTEILANGMSQKWRLCLEW